MKDPEYVDLHITQDADDEIFDAVKCKKDLIKLALTQEPIERAISILKAEGYFMSAIGLYSEAKRLKKFEKRWESKL